MDLSRALRPLALAAALLAAGESAPAGEPAPPWVEALRAADPPATVSFERAFPGVEFRQPVFLAVPPDGSGRVFVVGQLGEIWVLPDDDGATSKSLFLDLTGKVERGIERGLLGLAFDPHFARNGRFYVSYSLARSGKGILSRFRVSATDPDVADPASEEVLLEVPDRDGNHNGGMLAFGPDGMLYAGFGDDMDRRHAQDLRTPLGAVLRIDVSGDSYAIPADNPFASSGLARGEIWAYGLRNPWRFSFDRRTGDLWLGDVGEGFEEIDLVRRGGNYGWPRYDGRAALDNPALFPASDFEPPVHAYPRSCVIGGYVYRGRAVPALAGAYVYGDFNAGEVRALRYDGLRVTSDVRLGRVAQLSSFAEDRDGELLALGLDGRIWRLREGGAGGVGPPRRLSGTGLFASTRDLVAAEGVVEYGVNAELWADGATKRRWLALPPGGRVGFSAEGDWRFPVGTAIVKHFELPSPGGATRLETRVLLLRDEGWSGYTFRWEGDDAELLPDAEVGTYGERTWRFPGRAQCMQCHTPHAGFVLGLRTSQVNRDFLYPGGAENQLRRWSREGLLDRDAGDPRRLPALPDPADASAPVEARARAYLEANCAQCHRAGSTTPGGLDLCHDVALEAMNVAGVPPSAGDLGLPGAMRVKPGAKEASVLWERMRRLDHARMPPLGSDVPDEAAVALVGEWIDGLAAAR